jgi:uncharacterized protein YbjT (DUF2867 family)
MYVITGATGNTGYRIAEALLAAGKQVTVMGRSADKLKSLTDKGAKAAVGELEDSAFLADTFQGATAVYALIPPKWDVQGAWRDYQRQVGTSIAEAIRKAEVKKVVVLSSNGAHLPEGAGPVTGLYEFEQMLQGIAGLDILSLRAGYFMENLYANMGMIKGLGFFGYSLNAEVRLPVVHTKDIADVATRYLLSLDFQGLQPVFVPGQRDLTMPEVAKVLGEAIGKPDLHYVAFSQADAKAGMLQAGIPETIAAGYNELFDALNKGVYLNDYKRTPENTTPTSIEDFAKEFAVAYQQQ